MKKKRVVAKAPTFVERTLSSGQTLRIPVSANRITKPIELRDLVELKGAAGRVLVSREQKVQTKDNIADSVWVEFGPLWLQSNWNENNWYQDAPPDSVGRVQREVQNVFQAVKQQIKAGKKVR